MAVKATAMHAAIAATLSAICIVPVPGYADPNPVVEYEYVGLDRDGSFVMPANSDFWTARQETDERGINHFVGSDGTRFYNVSTVAFQAQGSTFAYPELNLAELNAGRLELSDAQLSAFDWLEENKRTLSDGSTTWDYTFPLNYNNILVTSPWPSAFAQAAVIHAYIAAHEVTKDDDYLVKAQDAARTFAVSVDEGGLADFSIDGLPFFEEVPLPGGRSPHILNGHLYAVAVLGMLGDRIDDPQIASLYDYGLELSRRTILKFDMGYWNRYDLRPRFANFPIQFTSEDTARIFAIDIVAPRGERLEIRPGPSTARWTVYGPAWTEFEDGWQLSGSGGYVQFHLPVEELSDWSGDTDFRVEVQLEAEESVPDVAWFGFRENISEYVQLDKLGETRDAQTERKVVSYRLPLQDLQWSSLQRYYVSWHTRLVQELAERSRDPLLTSTAIRWANYIAAYDADLAEQTARVSETIARSIDAGQPSAQARQSALVPDVLPVRPRLSEASPSAQLDTVLARVAGETPLADLNAAMITVEAARAIIDGSQSPTCVQCGNDLVDLLRHAGIPARELAADIEQGRQRRFVEAQVGASRATFDLEAGIQFTGPNGQPLSMAEIIADPATVVVQRLSDVAAGDPDYVADLATLGQIRIAPIDEAGDMVVLGQMESIDIVDVSDATEHHDGLGPIHLFDRDVTDGDYYAAISNSFPNGFTFRAERPVKPAQMTVMWNSPREYAKAFTLYGLSGDGATTLLEVTENDPAGQQEQTFAIDTDGSFDTFRIEVHAAAGQDRALMIQMDLKQSAP